MRRVIAVVNQKGGVGKTTTTANLGAALAARGRRVALIDMDPQECLSAGLGITDPPPGKTVSEVLRGDIDLAASLVEAHSMRIAPAGPDLAETEADLSNEPARDFRLRDALDAWDHKADYVLIDCPPSLGLLTLNALAGASEILIPVQTEFYALRRVGATLRTIEKARRLLNRRVRILAILPTLYDGRRLLDREVLQKLRDLMGQEHRILEPIPRTVRLAEAPIAGRPIFDTAAEADGATAYRRLAEEIDIP